MVIAVHAGGLKPVHLLLGENPHRGGNLDIHLSLDGGHGLLQLVHEPVVRAFDRSNNAKLGGARLLGLLGCLDESGDVQPGGPHRGFEQAGLGAEVAVLRAATGFERNNALGLDLLAAPFQAYLVG